VLLFGWCQVSFHDTSKHRMRVPNLTDYYGFTAASLGARGRPASATQQEQSSPLCWWVSAATLQRCRAEQVACSLRKLRVWQPAGSVCALIAACHKPMMLVMSMHSACYPDMWRCVWS